MRCLLLLIFFSLFSAQPICLVAEAYPPKVQNLLDEVLSHYFCEIPKNEITIVPLTGSHSVRGVVNLLITTHENKYALKIKADEPSLQSLQCEYFAMNEAGLAGIAPALFYTTDDHRAILMEYIEENTLTVSEANHPDNLINIAHTIRKAHELHKNPYCATNDDEAVESLFLVICDHPKVGAQAQDAIVIMRKCNEKLKHFKCRPVNNHGDLNSRNIFLTSMGPRLIDWEYTSWSDPFEDLSYFCLRHNYDCASERLFLASYLGRAPTPKELEKYALIKKKTFAQLCIYFYYFSLKLSPEGFDIKRPTHDWAHHMIVFSERREELPLAQLYFELALCALDLAKTGPLTK